MDHSVTQDPLNITISPLRKKAYSNILKILPSKKWKFSDENSDIFQTSAQNIDCGYLLEPPRRGGSNEYPQSIFWAEISLKFEYPCIPQFYCIKVGFKGGQHYIGMFLWCNEQFRLTYRLPISISEISHKKHMLIKLNHCHSDKTGIKASVNHLGQWQAEPFRKHAYSNILKFYHPKMKIFR